MERSVKNFFSQFGKRIEQFDPVLLALCVVSSLFGIFLIASATNVYSSHHYILVQSVALFLGILFYFAFALIDVDVLADHWKLLLIFSVVMISTLFVFGEAGDSGNKAWLRFGAIGIQPSEIVKIPFIILLAKQITHLHRRRGINHIFSILQMLGLFALMFGLIIVASSDLGSALVYLFIFIVMLFAGGVAIYWFLLGGAALAAISPLVWNRFLTEKQRNRILAPYDATVDPSGLGVMWQANQSKIALASGQITGAGLFHGTQTQSGAIPQQHTDFIFAVAGEELGLLGCMAIILLLTFIIIRCIQTGLRAGDRLGLLVCFGAAAMLIFQTFENIGMCIGLTPVIGLTLPFFSYGGSSIITVFACMGIVAGIRQRPKPSRLSRY